VNLLIIDEHQFFSAGLRILLQELCPGAGNSTAAGIFNATEKSNRCDLILLDFFLPDCKGLDGLVRIQVHYSGVPIAIVSSELELKKFANELFTEPWALCQNRQRQRSF
jgi:DNA-binding NarL/FixJ family response regulator